jgi:hypothetical protein
MQFPLHDELPVGQAQTPVVQLAPLPQTVPHVPQFVLSDLVSTHAPLHDVSAVLPPSPAHVAAHVPLLHTGVAPLQTVPHVPQ